ncbi:hypothetical protein D9756_011314 [Leucocoprinus leucothites]|uniref:Uncharacterized protein n=1 Tax=Leucocoprinus leucothites TaxID=201217 RepID=A0A8H5FP14_9AGAR|nr:hypothetical protein D9756_011314 [Leucoagaricus leucothites]
MLELVAEVSVRVVQLGADSAVVREGGKASRPVDHVPGIGGVAAFQRRRFNLQPQDCPPELLVDHGSCVPHILVNSIRKLAGQDLLKSDTSSLSLWPPQLTLTSMVSVGMQVEDQRAQLGIIARDPHQTYGDPSDWAVVEATGVAEDGYIGPSASVGATLEVVQSAEKIIAKVDTRIPYLGGLHDICASQSSVLCPSPPTFHLHIHSMQATYPQQTQLTQAQRFHKNACASPPSRLTLTVS